MSTPRSDLRPVVLLVGLAFLAVAALLPGTAAADVSFPGAARDLAARGDQLVWSGPEVWSSAPSPLMSGFGAAATALPVAPAHFQGLGLGTDVHGRTLLVYSACRTEGDSCGVIYTYSFVNGRERQLTGLSRRGCDLWSPQISRGVLVFGRSCESASKKRKRQLEGVYIKRPGRPARLLTHAAWTGWDISGRTLAFSRSRTVDEIDGSTFRVRSEIRVLRIGQRHSRLLASATGIQSRTSSGPFLQRPRLDGGFVYWMRNVLGSPEAGLDRPYPQDIVRRPVNGSEPARYLQRSGRLYDTPGGPDMLAYAVTGGKIFYSLEPPQATDTNNLGTHLVVQVEGAPVFN